MASDNPGNQEKVSEENTQHQVGALSPLPFEMQLHNTFIVEINAKKFPSSLPVDHNLSPRINLHLHDIQVNEESSQVLGILTVKVDFPVEPRLFEISFGILGLFIYRPPYTAEMARSYVENGSLSVLLPFARETLASLCLKMHVPIIYIPMLPIASSQSQEG